MEETNTISTKTKTQKRERERSSKVKEAKELPKFTLCFFCNKEIETIILKFHMDSHPSKIFDWLYLGCYNNAMNKKELEYANIKCIMNCAYECKNYYTEDFTYKHFKLSDDINEEIIKYFEEGIEFIEENKKNHQITFVHCQIGKSRSASFVIAYVMKHLQIRMEEAYKYVKKIRCMILPNLGFMKQLKEFEKHIFQ